MTYNKRLSARQIKILRFVLPQIVSLKPGEGISLETQDSGELIYALYTWRYLNDFKEAYRISKESPTSIRVLKRANAPKVQMVDESSKQKGVSFTQETLIDVLSEEEAKRIIKANLSAEEGVHAFEEWKRING